MVGSITIGTYIIDYRLNEFNDVSIKKINLSGFQKEAFLLYLSEQIKREKYYINFFVLKQICLDYDVFNIKEEWERIIKISFLSNPLTPKIIINFMNLDFFVPADLFEIIKINPKAFYHFYKNYYDFDDPDCDRFRDEYRADIKNEFKRMNKDNQIDSYNKSYIYQRTQEDYINGFLISTGDLIDDSDEYLLSYGVDPKINKEHRCSNCKEIVKLYKCFETECYHCGHDINKSN